MGGAGKTALARNIYESSLVKEHFDIRCWATISHEYDRENIILQLLSLTNGTELGERLYKSLSGKRYLIILDDVWSLEVWDCIKSYFPDTGNGSRVVVTTRLSGVATHLSSVCIIRINLLDEHKSWILFCQEVFGQEDCPLELVKIGKEIVKECKGLPLSIVVTGGLLRKSHRTREYWEDIANNIKSLLYSSENGGCLDALYLSYSHLPTHLKPCFLYMGTFKEDDEIRVSKIIKLWVAEGFLKPNGVQILEDIAEDYLIDLIGRNLIFINEYGSNGKIKSCSIHDLVRELCLLVGTQEKFFCQLLPGTMPPGLNRERRLIVYSNKALQSALLARSMIMRGWTHDLPVTKCRLLRVLSKVGDNYDMSLEAEMKNLNLRYLEHDSLSFNDDKICIHPSISLLRNLQTLVIRISRPIDAPSEIWKLAWLKHLDCTRVFLSDPPLVDEPVVLGELQTLKTVVNLRLSEEACKRIPNIKKLHLVCDSEEKGYGNGLLDLQNLVCFQKIESLSIECSEKLIGNDLLKNAFPKLTSLTKLCLPAGNFEELSLGVGSLAQLEVLKLRNQTLTWGAHQWSCVDGQFLRLKFLQIGNCDLRFWSLESAECFPVLEKLVLSGLQRLKEIPLEFGEIPTLNTIGLYKCSSISLVISAMKIKEEQVIKFGNDAVVIEVIMLTKAEEKRLRQMAEWEGLSISNIHLESDEYVEEYSIRDWYENKMSPPDEDDEISQLEFERWKLHLESEFEYILDNLQLL